MPERLKIYFLGSGPIAIPMLRKLAATPGLELVGVGTQIDRPAGRNRKPTPTPLGATALELGMNPERLADVNAPEFIAELTRLAPRILLVVSFGQLLKKNLLELPGCVCVNIHASLLPRYRGASPIVQCILNGDQSTGVCFMRMAPALDAGPVYEVEQMPLDHTEYADALELKLGELAAAAAPRVLPQIADGRLSPVPQDENAKLICRKIHKSDGAIDWNYSAEHIDAMIRAFTPWPGARCLARTSRGENIVTILKAARICSPRPEIAPGRVSPVFAPKRLVVGCGDGALEILELAPAGSRAMNARGYINGLRGELPEFTPLP